MFMLCRFSCVFSMVALFLLVKTAFFFEGKGDTFQQTNLLIFAVGLAVIPYCWMRSLQIARRTEVQPRVRETDVRAPSEEEK